MCTYVYQCTCVPMYMSTCVHVPGRDMCGVVFACVHSRVSSSERIAKETARQRATVGEEATEVMVEGARRGEAADGVLRWITMTAALKSCDCSSGMRGRCITNSLPHTR